MPDTFVANAELCLGADGALIDAPTKCLIMRDEDAVTIDFGIDLGIAGQSISIRFKPADAERVADLLGKAS